MSFHFLDHMFCCFISIHSEGIWFISRIDFHFLHIEYLHLTDEIVTINKGILASIAIEIFLLF